MSITLAFSDTFTVKSKKGLRVRHVVLHLDVVRLDYGRRLSHGAQVRQRNESADDEGDRREEAERVLQPDQRVVHCGAARELKIKGGAPI